MKWGIGALVAAALVVISLVWFLRPGSQEDERMSAVVETNDSAVDHRHAAALATESNDLRRTAVDTPTSGARERQGQTIEVDPAPGESSAWTADELSAQANTPLEELRSILKTLRSQLDEESSPLLWREVEAGRAEAIAGPGVGFSYAGRKEDSIEVCGILSSPELGVFRATLPRKGNEALYAMRKKVNALTRTVAAREARGED